MPDLWTDLLGCLDLRHGAQDSSFDGASQQLEYHRVFGGQLLGQFIRAANLTCPEKAVKSSNGTLFTSAVTSHTVWFHRQFRTDRWLLLRQHSPVLAHARCFGRGDVLTDDGELVASYAQEALLRFRDAGEKRSHIAPNQGFGE